jgi:hypothetical protein
MVTPTADYKWHPYIAHGRRQFRFGIWRNRHDRVSAEYRFLAIEWQLW